MHTCTHTHTQHTHTLQSKLSDTFTGKVVEVVSGDCLVIKDVASGTERRVQLSRCVCVCVCVRVCV